LSGPINTAPARKKNGGDQAIGRSRGSFRRLPAYRLLHQPLSTKRRQPGILVHVHSDPRPWKTEAS